MSYGGSDSIGLLMPNGSIYDYPGLDPSYPFNEELLSGHHSSPYWTTEFGFTRRDQFDGEPIGENFAGEQTCHSCFGYLLNELGSISYSDIRTDLFFSCHDTYGNENGCRMENTEDIHCHEDQFEDYNYDSRNLAYESAWDCLQSWFGHGEDEHGYDWSRQELKPTYDCSSDDMTLFDSILGYWPCPSRIDHGTDGHH